MPRLILLPLVLLLGACATPGSVHSPAGHPASPQASWTTSALAVAPLAPAAQPTLPAPLRAAGHDAPAHSGMHHDAGAHVATALDRDPDAKAPAGLAAALEAYLSLHDALAQDRLADVAAGAKAFSAALAVLTEAPPKGDAHFWHMRADEVGVVKAATAALAKAQGLDAARVSFGHLSVPFAGWVEALGAPAGFDVSRFTCGMFKGAPQGGVWLQRGNETRNPYYGAAMLTCGAHDHAAPAGGAKHDHGSE